MAIVAEAAAARRGGTLGKDTAKIAIAIARMIWTMFQ